MDWSKEARKRKPEIAGNELVRKYSLLRILMDWSKEATRMKSENQIYLGKAKMKLEQI